MGQRGSKLVPMPEVLEQISVPEEQMARGLDIFLSACDVGFRRLTHPTVESRREDWRYVWLSHASQEKQKIWLRFLMDVRVPLNSFKDRNNHDKAGSTSSFFATAYGLLLLPDGTELRISKDESHYDDGYGQSSNSSHSFSVDQGYIDLNGRSSTQVVVNGKKLMNKLASFDLMMDDLPALIHFAWQCLDIGCRLIPQAALEGYHPNASSRKGAGSSPIVWGSLTYSENNADPVGIPQWWLFCLQERFSRKGGY
jgi:hypothetical protein